MNKNQKYRVFYPLIAVKGLIFIFLVCFMIVKPFTKSFFDISDEVYELCENYEEGDFEESELTDNFQVNLQNYFSLVFNSPNFIICRLYNSDFDKKHISNYNEEVPSPPPEFM